PSCNFVVWQEKKRETRTAGVAHTAGVAGRRKQQRAVGALQRARRYRPQESPIAPHLSKRQALAFPRSSSRQDRRRHVKFAMSSEDRAALVALFRSTGGTRWDRN
ncbi:unnamed protein product, partial [Ectocarpus sp. 8 AP-2014]